MNKKQVIRTLETIAVYLEIKGENSFKISAYRRAALALESDERSMAQIKNVSSLKGIGKGTASVIEELLETGQSPMLEELKKEVPSGLIPLLNLPGVGGKKIAKLYQALGVVDIDSLKQACEQEKVRDLPGFGKKTEEKIIAAIEEAGSRPERLPIAFMLNVAADVEKQLDQIKGIRRYSRAGSLRRFKETIRDLDFVVETTDPEQTTEQLVSLSGVSEVMAKGNTKVSLELFYDYSVNVDFRLVDPGAFATALHHFTGSKEHNVKMRQLAKQRGEKISEYGVEVEETGEILTFGDETSFFEHFGLHYIPPGLRNGKEETERFKDEIQLLSFDDIKGDLHMHSTWSDGANTIEEMAEAARARGYKYIAITDHSKSLIVANGLSTERLKRQRETINRLNRQYDDFTILAGVEMDILPDGSLDYEDNVLENMDFVIASIHSSLSQSRDKVMSRLKKALANPHVDLIAHPTGRILGRRRGSDVDLEMLIELAKETSTALELNANPNRLDLAAKWLEKAQDQGVKVALSTDAHTREALDIMEIGINEAEKGWLRPDTVINTWRLEELLRYLNRHER